MKLPALRKATMGSRAKKAVAVYPDGTGGAVYVYFSNGHFHNVHAGAKQGVPVGETNEANMYDHPNATVSGMNADQIGRTLGTFQGRLNEAVAGKRDPKEAHRDELMHAEKMGQYSALKAHHENFGVAAPAAEVSIKHQAGHIGPVVDGLTSMLHNIRMVNAKMPVKNRAAIASHFYDHVTKSLTDVARQITGNPNLRFDYQQGGLVHGAGKGISNQDMQKLQDSGYFKDAHSTIKGMAEQLQNPVPENFLETIKQGHRGFEGETMRPGQPAAALAEPKVPTDIQGRDWFHPDIGQAKSNFMKPIGNLMGKIRGLAQDKLLREGYGQQQAEALSHRLIGDIAGKMSTALAESHGIPNVRIGLTPEGSPILDMPHDMHNHQALASMDAFRQDAAHKLANYYAQLKGGK